MDENPSPAFRERYMDNKRPSPKSKRQLITVEEMSSMVHAILNPRDHARVLPPTKTSIRRGKLIALNVDDINWGDHSITLKSTPKRPNQPVFFDG